MINPNKSVVIFSHPRSGSTWFQNSLPQFSLGELFNLNIDLTSYDNDNIHFKFDKHGYNLDTVEKELQKRFDVYNHFELIKGAVSLKIHSTILNNQMVNFLKTKKVQTILLERLNKSDTFWSFLISWNLNNWHEKIEPQSIKITSESFKRVINIMSNYEHSLNIVHDNFSTVKLFYEDLISMPNNEWFTKTSKYKVMNGKSIVNITNLEEVNNWLKSIGYAQWIRI